MPSPCRLGTGSGRKKVIVVDIRSASTMTAAATTTALRPRRDAAQLITIFPCRTLLQFTKKKRKRYDSGSDDGFDRDATPPSSPKEDDPSIEKRRSGRNTQRKKGG